MAMGTEKRLKSETRGTGRTIGHVKEFSHYPMSNEVTNGQVQAGTWREQIRILVESKGSGIILES